MKLPIKKKYFDEIKSGKKQFEYRDGHITFICEETKEQLRKEIKSVDLIHISKLFSNSDLSLKEIENLFDDNWIMKFGLK